MILQDEKILFSLHDYDKIFLIFGISNYKSILRKSKLSMKIENEN